MYSDIAFAEHIDLPLSSIVEIDMTKTGVSANLQIVSDSGVCSILQPAIILFFFSHCAEYKAKPKTITLEWKTNKCLI